MNDERTNGPAEEDSPGPGPTCEKETLLERVEDHWFEIASAALLALATMMSAWCAFTSAQWYSTGSKQYNDSSVGMIQASELFEKADQLSTVDVISFTNYYDAAIRGDTLLAHSYEKRAFSAPLRKAFAAWIALDPLNNKDAPPSPFTMPEYRQPRRVLAEERELLARRQASDANESMQRANAYILLTVLFASVLFFAGISTKFKSQTIKVTLVVLGTVVFLCCVVLFIVLP